MITSFPPASTQALASEEAATKAAQGANGGVARAQTATAAAPQDGGKQKPAPGVIVLEAEVIKGKIHKPEAFYILQRSDLNYQSLDQKKSFIPQIIESTAGDAF